MIISHLLLYFFCCIITLDLFHPSNKKNRRFIIFLIFLFIAIDPTILGYYHVVLTEYVAATFAIISCFAALRLFKSPIFSKRFFLWSFYFLLTVPISWHLKQPYIGAAYFPFITCCLLIIMREFSKKTIAYGLIINLLIISSLVISAITWNAFLISQNNPMNENRLFSTVAETKLNVQIASSEKSPIKFGKELVTKYLASSNFFLYNGTKHSIIKEPSLIRGNQNRTIAHRMFFNYGKSNISIYPDLFDQYTSFFKSTYNPPIWLNTTFQARATLSNFLFTITYLLLPFFVLVNFAIWIRRKNEINTALLILGSSSLLNALIHLFAGPLDRYLFWGYPLNLLIVVISFIYLIILIKKRRNVTLTKHYLK